jgi:hypothetical protein
MSDLQKDGKNSIYWSYNLPLQVWPVYEDPETVDFDSCPVVGTRILNYMPRKRRCEEIELSDVIGDQTREEFFETAAIHLENLARLMRTVKDDPRAHVYYHDSPKAKNV